jgi:iron complex outermembrane receptor protein
VHAQSIPPSPSAGSKPARAVTPADAAPTEEESALPSVKVTAQKREESSQEVATAITTLSGDDLQKRDIGRSASEVLDYVPNSSAGTQQHGRPRWWIRGVGAGQQQIDLANPVGFYRDEVYISNSSATGFPLFDLERVEVLRGPQGTLWGKNTTGGAISVVSKKPSFNDTKTDDYIKLGYGKYSTTYVEGAVGGVIADERIAGRISFQREDTDGFFRNQFTGKRDGGLEDWALRGQLLFQLSRDLEALLIVHGRKYETDGAITTTASYAANGVYRNGYIPSRNKKHVSSNADGGTDQDQYGAVLKLNWQLGKLTFTSITGFESWDGKTLLDSDYTPLEISRSYTDARSRQWSQEFRLASSREDRWNWIVGAHYFDESTDSISAAARLPDGQVPQQVPVGAAAAQFFNSTTFDHDTKSFAVFGSNTYNFTERLLGTLGVRWSHEKKELDFARIQSPNAGATSWSDLSRWWSSYTGGIGGANTFSRELSKSWDHFTYDITPTYKLTPTDRVFLKYAHGVKSGGFNTAAAAPIALQEVKPEKLDSVELGYKSEWFDGRLNFNATAFHYDYRDIQVNVVGPNPAAAGVTISYLQNASKGSADGLELEIEALPTNRLYLSASVGLLKTKFDDLQVVNGGANLSGNEFVRSPRYTGNINADYRLPLADGSKLVFGADARYISHQFYYVTPQSKTTRDLVNQEAYTIANARIVYSTAGDRYSVTAYVKNLFDREYKNHALPAFGGPTNGDIVYWGTPRTFGVNLVARF